MVTASRLSELIEMDAWSDLFEAAPRSLASAIGLDAARVGGALSLLAPGVPTPMLNRVIGLGSGEPANDEQLTELVNRYSTSRVVRFWVQAEASEHGALLQSRGFTVATPAAWAKMVRLGEPFDEEDSGPIRARPIAPDEARALASVLTSSHGISPGLSDWYARVATRPRWLGFGGFDGDRLVGGGLLFVDGACAWLGVGGTLPLDRRRGVHRAVLRARVKAALSLGCTVLVTEAVEPAGGERNPSLDNMVALGFRPVSARTNFELICT